MWEWIKKTHKQIVIWKAEVASKKHLNQPVIKEVLSEISTGATRSFSHASKSNNRVWTQKERVGESACAKHEPIPLADKKERVVYEQRWGQVRETTRGADDAR